MLSSQAEHPSKGFAENTSPASKMLESRHQNDNRQSMPELKATDNSAGDEANSKPRSLSDHVTDPATGDTKPMLEVHAPHEGTHGWRGFMVHIAAIAIGLLLALALEKLAEYAHERRQLTEARRELVTEVAENRRRWTNNVSEASRVENELNTDLKAIRALAARVPLDGLKLDYSVRFYAVLDGPWQAVRQSGSLSLMPDAELQTYAWFHAILASLMESMHALETSIQLAGAIAKSGHPEELSPRDLDDLRSRTLEALGRLENLRMFLGYEGSGLDGFEFAKIRTH
jgi:hypothetical protein